MLTKQQYHKRKIRDLLDIEKAITNKRSNILNRDEENLVKTNTSTPLFENLTKKETTQRLDVKLKKDFNSIVVFHLSLKKVLTNEVELLHASYIID